MSQFFKKPNGIVIQVNKYHDVASLKERFEECDANGKAIRSEKKATKKPSKKYRLEKITEINYLLWPNNLRSIINRFIKLSDN